MDSGLLALTVHAIGFTFWVGGLFAVALVMSAAGAAEGRARIGAIARRVMIATDAAAGITIAGGLVVLMNRSWDLHQPWMHIKLTFAVGLIALHGIVRVRAKRLANGGAAPGLGAPLAVALLAIGIIAMVMLKPMAR
jgi:uncharacterized membrane protein